MLASRARFFLAPSALFLAAACSAEPPVPPRDASPDVPRDAAPDVAQGDVVRPDVPGRTCVPSQRRCSPDAPLATQLCNADGSAWVDDAACDAAVGQRCSAGRCVDRCTDLENGYLGCEYWPTVTPNTQLVPTFEFAVAVSNPQSYPVNVTLEGGALAAPRTQPLAPGEVATVTLPWVQALSQNAATTCMGAPRAGTSARAANGAYRLRADGPIAAYQFNPLNYRTATAFSFSNDASLLLPTNVLGMHYIAVVPPANSGRGGFISIVGAQATGAATVTARLTAPVANPDAPASMLAAGEHAFTVARGEVVLLMNPSGDLTGSILRSDQPIAVYVGHDCSTTPGRNTACDHLEEQLLPSATWGTAYAVSQFRDRGADEVSVVRVVSQRDGNVFTFDGIPAPSECAGTFDQGRFCQFETAGNFQVRGSRPLLVAQFMDGLATNPACAVVACTAPPDMPQCVGDPAMVFETPIDQYRNAFAFLVPATYTRSYVNVTAPAGEAIELDGAPVTATSVPTGAGYVTYFIEITAGAHRVRATSATARFGVKVYGVASYTSYAYPGGLDLAPISPPG